MQDMWFNSMRPWWKGFILSWVVVSFGLRLNGMEGDVAVRFALVTALLVAALIWGAMRVTGRIEKD